LRQFFIQLNVELVEDYDVDKLARVYLSANDVSTIRQYLSSQRHSEEVALREKLRAALERFIMVEVSYYSTFNSNFFF
jgi:hypothetical protein